MPGAQAQDDTAVDESGAPLETIIVTATRREASVQSVPFNIAAIGSGEIERQRLDDLADVTRVVPGLYLANQGPRGSNPMTVRGLNLDSIDASESVANGTGGTVATYLGEIPLFVDLKMLDIARIEALLGPQGTLYGVGTLAGAIRYIPNRPDLLLPSAEIQTRLFGLKESDGVGLKVNGVVNVPLIEDRLALRVVLGYIDDPGFIDYDYLVREPGVSNPQPDFDDPADVAANLRSEKDVDGEETISGRVALLWQVTEDLAANLTYYYQDQDVGGRTVNHEAAFDTGKYVSAARFVEPNDRKNHLFALEIEWDLGFADLTSATGVSKFDEHGQRDQTDLLLDFQYGYEDFPSFAAYTSDESEEKTFNQELRLVSKGEGAWSWIAGVFYNRFETSTSSKEFTPGYPEFRGMPAGTPDLEYFEVNDNTFEEQAIFGELGYRITDSWQVTVGARWFDFEDDVETGVAFPFFEDPPGTVNLAGFRNQTGDDDVIFKFNTSYEFTDDVMTYFTVSEGFRRGGVNSGPLCPSPNFCLAPDEVLIKPDTTVNYEFGLRSTWLNDALLVNAALYVVEWDDIQVNDFSFLGGLPIVVNGSAAETRGIELSTEWQVTDSLRLAASYSYNQAELTQDSPGLVNGQDAFSGDRLPGTPEQQGAFLANYSLPLSNGWLLEADYGITAVSDVYTKTGLRDDGEALGGYAIHSAAIGVSTDRWSARLYADNLFDKFAITSVRRDRSYIQPIGGFNSRTYFQSMLRPLSVGVELSYKFDL